MRYNELVETSHSVILAQSNTPVPFVLSPSSKRHGDVLVDVNVNAVNASWKQDADFYVGPGGQGGIGKRYDNFGKFINSTEIPIEASEVYVDQKGQVSFNNGRHRFAYLRDQGITTIPVAMSPDAIENAKKFNLMA
jgi:hypothetical protein